MTQTVLEEQSDRNATWNFAVNLSDIIFITLGLSLISRDTVLPLLISHLTDSKIAIGLLPAIASLGFYLPQLFTASFAEELRYKKPFVIFVGGLGERLPYAFIGLAVWAWAVDAPTATLVIILLGIGIATVSYTHLTLPTSDLV